MTTATKTREEVLASLQWSEPREVNTRRGPKHVRSADVQGNKEVEDIFRNPENRDWLWKAGYSVSVFKGRWQAAQWSDVPKVQSAAKEEAKALSRATDVAGYEPAIAEGMAYMGFQKAGVKFGLSRPATLIGDEPGLGKTLQSIGIANESPEAKRILVICPASLKYNWRNEFRKFGTVQRAVYVLESKNSFPDGDGVVILNYDILHVFAEELRAVEWDILVCDEAHYMKSPDSRRTKMVVGHPAKKSDPESGIAALRAKRRLFLTGTPIPNRPVEIWPLIHYLDPERWTSFWKFAKRYCGAFKENFGRRVVWNTSGATNLEELQEILRSTIMVRRLKKDVLTELPPKRRQVIEFPATGKLARFAEAEREAYESREDNMADLHAEVELAKASENPDDYRSAVEKLRKGIQAMFAEISTMRAELAQAKAPLLIEFLKDAVEESRKCVFMVHHKAVVQLVAEAFGDEAVLLVGDTPVAERQAAVERFQKDPACKLFIGSIQAAGVGITLTAASRIIFGELDWVPGNVTQAEDRIHRIGQKESVLVQHLVVEGSLDATMAKKICAKQSVIDAALDTVRAKIEGEPVLFTDKQGRGGATVETTADKLAKEAEEMTEDQRKASHEALKFIAGRCNGARDWDGVGFSKLDTRLGIDLANRTWLSPKQAALARRVAKKYRNTQLPESIVARMGGLV